MILDDDAVWIVEISSSFCGSCKEFAPEWEALTKSMKTMKAGHVNMDDADGKEFADLIGASAEGIPNIKLFRYKDQFAAVPVSGLRLH